MDDFSEEGHSALDGTTHRRIASLSINTKDSADDHAAPASSDGSDCAAGGGGAAPARPGYAQQLRLAEVLAGGGRHEDALAVLDPLLAQRPEDPRALCLQGGCLAGTGARAQALAAFAGALAADPEQAEALLGCAALYRDSGLFHEALASVEKAHALAAAPAAGDDDAAALADRTSRALAVLLTDLGTQMKVAGQPGWRDLYKRAVAACPSFAPAHYNLGVGAAEGGDADEAAARYARAAALEPLYAEAWCNLGGLHRAAGRLEEAVAALEAAYAAAPEVPLVRASLAVALTDRGNALRAAGDREGGMRAYERALALEPRYAEALYNAAWVLAEAGELHRAAFMYQMAVAAAPQCADALNNLGSVHRELGNRETAMRCYAAALEARPSFPRGLNNLAVMYTQQGRAAEALGLLRAAVLADPGNPEAHNNLGVLQRDVGDAAAAVAAYEACLALDPDSRNAGQNRLLALNYVTPGEGAACCAAHAAWGRRFQELHPRLPPLALADVDPDPARPLVVGYLSPDLCTHSVSYFAEAPLTWHDPARVRQVVYSVCAHPDARTAALRRAVAAAGGAWREAARLTEGELAAAVRADRVDILVELTGHTANNRLGAVARAPAPVQATWIGYPNSTGLEAVQYRLTDGVCDPQGTAQTFAEELVRLPGCFLCYTPPADAPPVAPPPAARNGFLTFGSFNALAKHTPEVLRAWARILRALPSARLVLKNKPFACAALRRQAWRVFEGHGVARERVDLFPLAPATRDHLAQYALVDVALDPWPYAGTTTTAEALYMGVPCLTLAGACHAHNVGASLVGAVGLGEAWVARDVGAYVAAAVALGGDLAALGALRAGLRARMEASPLCDAPRFVRGLEDTYRELWRRWLAAAGGAAAEGGAAPGGGAGAAAEALEGGADGALGDGADANN